MKHNVMKRTLAGVMAVLTVAAYMPANVGGFLTEGNGIGIVASADGEAISLNSLEANSDGELVLGTGSYILSQDATLGMITIEENAIVTLDLNGYKITTDKHSVFVKGELTITDTSANQNGTIESLTESAISINSNGVLTINAGNYIAQEVAVLFGSKVCGAKATINGGVFTTRDNFVLGFNGTARETGTENDVNTLTVNDGIFNGNIISSNYVACGIYCPQNDVVDVNGGIFNINGGAGILARAGKVTVDGGIFNCTGTVIGKIGDSNIIVPCSPIVFDDKAKYPGLTEDANITVTGGTFNSDAASIATIDDVDRVTVTGGNFNTTLDSDYIADGYMQDKQGNVIAKSDYNWVLTESKTYTLEEDMVCKTITVPNGVNATIDMNGHTLTVNQCVNVGEGSDETADSAQYGELTVKNGTLNSYVYLNWYSKMTVNSNATVISDKNSTLLVMAYSTLDVYGTVETTKSGECAIIGWGNSYGASGTKSYGSILNIYNGARIICVNDNAIQHPQDGTINMYGGTVQGNTGIYAKGGNINISGGTVKAVGPTSEVSYNNNGSNTTGDALVIKASSKGYAGVGSVKITGGTFTSENGKAVATYSAPDTPYTLPTGFITGGTFNKPLDSSYISEGYEQETSGKVSKTKPVVAEKLCTITTIYAGNPPYTTDIYSLSDYTLPKADYLDGMEFIGWLVDGFMYYSESAAQTAIDGLIESKYNFTVEVVYEKINNDYTVKVDSNQEVYYQVSDLVKVKPVPAYSGKFSHWERKDGDNGEWTIVSYNETYSFYMPSSNVELRSIYVENDVSVEEAATAVIESITPNSSEKKVSFVSVINVPKNCTFVKGGLVATSDSSIGANVNANNAAYVKLSTKATAGTKNLKYTWTKSNATANWYVRGYVVYKDSKGVEHTVYSTAVCANSSGIINLS